MVKAEYLGCLAQQVFGRSGLIEEFLSSKQAVTPANEIY